MNVRFALLLAAVLLLAVPAQADDGDPGAVPAASKDLDAIVRELMPVVARVRGLEWKRPVEAQMLSKAKLRAHLVKMMEQDYPQHEQDRDNRIVHRLGMLPEDQKIAPLVRRMLEEMVAGYYDPVAKKLFVVEGPVGDARKPTLFHELIHALDDQHFDLKAIERPFEDDADRQFAIRCLWEGCAMHGQLLYGAIDPKAAAAEIRQAFDAPDTGSASALADTPTWLIVNSLLHYRAGPYLVGQLAQDDFAGTMQRLFEDPPTTQEQFLHPERWLDPTRRDLPRQVQWAGPWDQVGYGWHVVHDTPIGELNFALMLNHFLDDDDGKLGPAEVTTGQYVTGDAREAATGWDAGRSVVLERAGNPLVLVHAFAFDSLKDAEEAGQALLRALKLRNIEVWKTPDDWSERTRGELIQTTTYADGRGMGAVVRRGRALLWVDGFDHPMTWTKETGRRGWLPLLEHLERTHFVQDPNDKGDHATGSLAGAKNPFADCALVIAQRGLGVCVPTDEWTAERGAEATEPGKVVATVTRKGAEIDVRLIEQGLTKGALPVLLDAKLDEFDAKKLRPMRVAGWDGLHYPVLRTPGRQLDVYAGSDGVRTVLIVVRGQTQILRLYDDEIERIVGEIVSVPGY